MKVFDKLICLLVASSLSSCMQPTQVKKTTDPTRVVKPHTTVESYHFNSTYDDAGTAKAFTFSDKGNHYSIRSNTTGKIIVKDIYHVKTFGGVPPTINIDLINNRYIVLPRTIKNSNIPNTQFNEMKAITRIYDLKTGERIIESKPYKYDHNVPLRYDMEELSTWIYLNKKR